MICVDTTFLIDLWRSRRSPAHPAVALLERFSDETFLVPAHAAGEFLEGGASVSAARLEDALRFLRLFDTGVVGIETALHYARVVSHLRRRDLLRGQSKADMWIAASALEHGAPLVTRDVRHLAQVPDLAILEY